MRVVAVYDNRCQICRRWRRVVRCLDWFDRVRFVGVTDREDLARIHSGLDPDRCLQEMHLITAGGRVYRGFFAIRRLMASIVPGWVLLPILYFPGVSWVGKAVYRRIAASRGRNGGSCPRHG